jgi:uncharacterized protein with von Willebrand factor type A (vWA) domain
MHVLAQTRAAAVAALTGLATTGANVYTQETYPWQASQMPALLVTTTGEPTAETLDWPTQLRWDISLQVEAMARATGNLCDLLDTIASEVQIALCAVSQIGGFTVQIIPVSFQAPQFAVDGDQPVARRLMSFDVRSLYTEATDPDTLI